MKAYELLSKEGSWCQDHHAIDKNGELVEIHSIDACSWCASGAIRKCYTYNEDEDYMMLGRVNRKLMSTTPFDSVVEWNDSPDRTREQVVAFLKELDI